MPAQTMITKVGQYIDLTGIGKSGDYSESELDEVLNNPEYNKGVVSAYISHSEGKKAIVFVSGVEHADDLAEEFRKKGVACQTLHSKTTAKMNEMHMREFRHEPLSVDRVDVLVTVSMLTTGFDMPACNMIINSRPTKIRSLYTQMIGRVLRPDGSSKTALILDCCQSTMTHGLYDEEFNISDSKPTAKVERKRVAEPVVSYLASVLGGDFMVNRRSLTDAHKEALSRNSPEAKMWRFMNADTHRGVLLAASILYEDFYKIPHKASKVDWILDGIKKELSWFTVNMLRNRLKKMLKEGKKMGGIRSYPSWFKENVLNKGY